MKERAVGINPNILIWARERSGRSIENVAESLNKGPNDVQSWERGETFPTYVQLETLAYTLYKRPLAIFFFPEPPDEPDPKQSFRTLPDFELENLLPDTRYKIRKALSFQLSLAELNDGRNPSERKIHQELKIDYRSPVLSIVKQIRNFLEAPVGIQEKWSNQKETFENWRNIVESVGVFVFKDSFKQENVSGLCLSDIEFPIIYINNSLPHSRQTFTLFHELSHLLLNSNSITLEDDFYIDFLSGEIRQIEIFCNKFAGEFLVPSSHFQEKLRGRVFSEAVVKELANYYKVSREVVLRKFLDQNQISPDEYSLFVEKWVKEQKEREKRKKKSKGGDYYATQATYLGDNYMKMAFSRYYQGKCSVDQLSNYLNIKTSNVANLENFFLK